MNKILYNFLLKIKRYNYMYTKSEPAKLQIRFWWVNLGTAISYVGLHHLLDMYADRTHVSRTNSLWTKHTGLFISPSGISELDCAKTKTDTAERSISIGRQSLQVSVLPYRCSICAPLVTRQMSIKFLRHALHEGCTYISSTCKVGQKLGEILYLLICSFLPCLSWLLRSRVRKSRRDLWITLYNENAKYSLCDENWIFRYNLDYCCLQRVKERLLYTD